MPQPRKSSSSTSKTSPRSAVRTLAPAAPLAIALLASAILPGSKSGPIVDLTSPKALAPMTCDPGIADFRDCHEKYPTGCTKNGSTYDTYLNELKNQIKWGNLPSASVQPKEIVTSIGQLNQLEQQIQSIGLTKGNHADLSDKLAAIGEGSVFGVVGYLYAIEPEGAESSNCQLEGDVTNVDYHIFVGFDPDVAKKLRENHGKGLTSAEKHQSMVVEMTPHYRDAFHAEWTVDAVKEVVGQQVKVLGQLMVDNEHFVSGQDCGIDPTKPKCWRASVWELHPVIDFQSCPNTNCSATSSAGWGPIGMDGKDQVADADAGKSTTKGKQ